MGGSKGALGRALFTGLAASTLGPAGAAGAAALTSGVLSVAEGDRLGEGLLKATISGAGGAGLSQFRQSMDIAPLFGAPGPETLFGTIGGDGASAVAGEGFTNLPASPLAGTGQELMARRYGSDILPNAGQSIGSFDVLGIPPEPEVGTQSSFSTKDRIGLGLDAAQLALLAQQQFQPRQPVQPRSPGVPFQQPLPIPAGIPPQIPPLFGNLR